MVKRVNVDFTASMLQELDREVAELNITRQAVIKTLVRRALEERYVPAAGRTKKQARLDWQRDGEVFTVHLTR